MVKLVTQSIWVLSHIYCWVWKLGRNLFRKSDFDYFIRNLQTQYPTTTGIWTKPFFHKVVLVNDDYEKSRSVKIGNVTIEYSFDKTIKKPNYFITEPKWEVAKSLYKLTKQSHYNASVVYLKDHKKGKRHGRKTGLN